MSSVRTDDPGGKLRVANLSHKTETAAGWNQEGAGQPEGSLNSQEERKKSRMPLDLGLQQARAICL